ncbi:MAG: double-strand break repair protein AddB [Rhodobacteraceae bacterium]|nr:double-strand break repair protein AddB [Paracoccaceae bacterium]
MSELASAVEFPDVPDLAPRIERRLRLAKRLRALPGTPGSLKSHGTVIPLAETLESLLDEMDCEGVSSDDLSLLDLVDISEHWHNSFTIIQQIHTEWDHQEMPGEFGRLLLVVKALQKKWSHSPPDHPILVAGSTGSLNATRLFMQCVAKLPQGAVVLPCFDRALPASCWGMISDRSAVDHPQHNIATFLQSLEVSPSSVPAFFDTGDQNRERNRLVSMMMRPIAGTRDWVREGPGLDMGAATQGLTLIEANSERQEAVAIATAIRQAVEDRKSVALVTPDRRLIRQVCSALLRWSIVPDNRFGTTLDLTQAGSFLLTIARMMGREVSAVDVITLLEHPLASSEENREWHQRFTDRMNLEMRRKKPGDELLDHLYSWTERLGEHAVEWIVPWLQLFTEIAETGDDDLVTLIHRHRELATMALRGGSDSWDATDGGAQCLLQFAELQRCAGDYGVISPGEYADLIKGLLYSSRCREDRATHHEVMIWNTEDARMQRLDRIIAGRLNAGVWPPDLQPDIWLSEQIRTGLGLPLSEHRVGLSAHDFQHVMALDDVILTRCSLTATASTLPSSWLVRMISLLTGVEGGRTALRAMRERGQSWLALVGMIDKPVDSIERAKRPAPCPPEGTRPVQMAVTSLPALITNPYAIYAQSILNLHVLNALSSRPDLRIRGTTIHRIMECFLQRSRDLQPDEWRDFLREIADREFDQALAPKHTIMIWKNVFNRIFDPVLDFEKSRPESLNLLLEKSCQYRIPDLGFTLNAKADRIEINQDGSVCQVYDYKTGNLPGAKKIKSHEFQVPILVKLAELGAFTEEQPVKTSRGGFIKVGDTFEVRHLDDIESDFDIEAIWSSVLEILAYFQGPEARYVARRRPGLPYGQEYDHLARYEEWRYQPADTDHDPV